MSFYIYLGFLMTLFGYVYTEECFVSKSQQEPKELVKKDCDGGCCKDDSNFSDCCDKGILIGVIVGIITGVIVLTVVIVIIVLCFIKYKNKKRIEDENRNNYEVNASGSILMVQPHSYRHLRGNVQGVIASPGPSYASSPPGYPGTPNFMRQQAFDENEDPYPVKE